MGLRYEEQPGLPSVAHDGVLSKNKLMHC